MNNSPLVSIIIPTYNRAHLIGETLESITAQTYTNWECIVVDDGSIDNTLLILEDYSSRDKRFRLYKRPEDKLKGANACRNYGFELSVGDYIVFMDSDDLLAKYCFKSRVSEMMKSEMDFIVFKTGKFSDSFKGTYLPFSNLEINNDRVLNLKNFLEFKIPWQTTSPIYKRKFIIKNKFDESLLRYQDYEFHIRLLLNKDVSFYCIDNVDNFYRKLSVDTLKSNQDFSNKLLISFLLVYKSIINEIRNNKEYKDCFKIYVKKNMINVLYQNISLYSKRIEIFHRNLIKDNMFSYLEVILFRNIYILKKYNLNKYPFLYSIYRLLKNKFLL